MNTAIPTILAALLALTAAVRSAHAQTLDDAEAQLSAYLDQRGTARLLAEQLEARLAAAPSDEKTQIAERLAEVYEQLLSRVEDPAEQRDWESRSEALLALVPEADSAGLRLGLARAAYDRLEGFVRSWRLRTLTGEEASQIDDAISRFHELEQRLTALAQDAHQRVRTFERQEESGRALDFELVGEAVELARQHRSLAHYLAGWCAYHVAEMSNNPDQARAAAEHFGWLLNAEQGAPPEIERLPTQLLLYEHVARAAIAVALCESVRGRTRQAIDWLDAMEAAEALAPGIPEQLLSARLMVLARGARWAELDELVARARQSGPIGPAQARLLAVWSLEATGQTPGEQTLIDSIRAAALGELVSTGELAQIIDLSERYRIDTGDAGSFLALFVSGLNAFQQARTAQEAIGEDTARPTASASVARAYADAALKLDAALRAPDAANFIAVRGQASHLVGTCLFNAVVADPSQLAPLGAGDPMLAAAQWFDKAADELADPVHIAGARWMAVRALDERLRLPGATRELLERREAAAERFLARHPDDDRAAALVLQRAADSEPTEAVLQQLLAVPEDSSMYASARRRAAGIAYELFKRAPEADRPWQAARFIELAQPLLALDRRLATRDDHDAAALAVHRARQIVEVALSVDPSDLGLAERTLDVIASMIGAGQADGNALGPELLYRRAQIALKRGDVLEAERLVDELQQADPDHAGASSRLFYNHALREWRRAERIGDPPADRLALARSVVKHGRRVAADLHREGAPDGDDVVTTLTFNIAEALTAVWTAAADREALTEASAMYRDLVDRFPTDRRALEGLGATATALGDHAAAVECWRTLLAGEEPGTDAWFGYRVRIVEGLRIIEPDRAREVLRQHAVLMPDYGPAPWGPRLRAIATELGVQGPPS